jgi:hypothetical protein
MRAIWGYLKIRSTLATYAVLIVALVGVALLLCSSTATAGYPEGEELFRENIKKGNELGIGASPTLLMDDEKYTGRIFPKASGTPYFLDTCTPNNDGCIGLPSPCTTDADCPNDGWYCDEMNDINHFWDWSCENGECTYIETNTKNCNDLYDGWHCAGKDKKQEWDGYCEQDSFLICEYRVLEEVDCDDYDKWSCDEASDINEFHDYECEDGECTFTVITRNCNDYDGWHCAGGGQKRQKWDAYCEQDSLLVCDYDVLVEEDCDDYDVYGEDGEDCSCVDGYCDCVTLVALASFTATPYDGYVLVEWETASEIDNEGFNLWRSETRDGQYVQLNAALIPARGGPTLGASYTYEDADVTDGVTYYYKLEDVDTHGTSTFHGPVLARSSRVFRIFVPLVVKGR